VEASPSKWRRIAEAQRFSAKLLAEQKQRKLPGLAVAHKRRHNPPTCRAF
jgi:hypothetical protein